MVLTMSVMALVTALQCNRAAGAEHGQLNESSGKSGLDLKITHV